VAKEKRSFWRQAGHSLNPLFDDRETLREDLEPLFRRTGSITVTTLELISVSIWTGDSPGYIVTDRLSSFEVNSIITFWLAEHIADDPRIVFKIDDADDIGLTKVYRTLTLGKEMDDLLNCSFIFVRDPAYEGGILRIPDSGFEIVEAGTGGKALNAIRSTGLNLIFIDIPVR
jgi:hypothetical protein